MQSAVPVQDTNHENEVEKSKFGGVVLGLATTHREETTLNAGTWS